MYAQYESTDGSFLLPLSRDRSRECESSLIQILARTKNCAVFKNKNYDVSKLNREPLKDIVDHKRRKG